MAKITSPVKPTDGSHGLRRVIFEMEDGSVLLVDGVFITRASIAVQLDRQTEFEIHGCAPFVPSRYNHTSSYTETGYTEVKQLKG